MRKFAFLFCLLLCGLLRGQILTPGLLQKCAPALLDFSGNTSLKNESYSFYTLQVDDLQAFISWAQTQNIRVARSYAPARLVVVQASLSDLIEKILPHPAVQFADRSAPQGRAELPVPGHNFFVNRINAAHRYWPLLNGAGITVSVKEFRFDSSDVDFRGRYLPSPKSAAQLTDHAHIMASLIAGAGNSDPAGQGVAPGVQLTSSNFVGLLPDDAADYAAQNISVQNHSYGIAIENYYGLSALAYDHSVALRPELLHVFSAGNDGLMASSSGIYANIFDFANLTGNFKMAKNVLTVGSVDSFGQTPPFSSRGPAYDGRIKPDLVAFGAGGTSESAALVSGAAAVLQQAFFEKNGARPSASTLRAVLLNTTDDIAPPGPDFTTGFGNLHLKNALQTVLNQSVEVGKAADGSTRVFSLELPPKVRRVRVTLAWDDPPASPGSARALINDLDLVLRAPDGAVWQPWILNTAPQTDSLRQPARRGRDSLNNVEQISLDFPLPGLYQMEVYGRRVLPENQLFALTFTWDTLDQFVWDSPVRNDPAIAGREAILRWTTQLPDSTGRIEWRPIGSIDWRLINPAATLATGVRRWLVPDTFTAAQVRMVVGSQVFVSDTFLITRALRMRVGFNCKDSVLLRWNAPAPDAAYQLWGFGDRYLERLRTTNDTFWVLQKKDFPQQRFTVSALGQGGGEGPKSPAPDIATQGVGCYISSFLAELSAAFQIDITLQMGTTYGVHKVYLEKIKNGVSEELYEEAPQKTLVAFTDSVPHPGVNRYFARVEFLNGFQLFSDTLAVYFTGASNRLIFPNPVSGSGTLSVLSQTPDEATFELFDALGRHILEQNLSMPRVDISLPSLPPGCYQWRIQTDRAERRETGRVVVAGKR